MKTKFLLPNRFKLIGWLLFIPSFILGFLVVAYDFEMDFFDFSVFAFVADETLGTYSFMSMTEDNFLEEILGLIAIVGGLMVAFSKVKLEDEYIQTMRLNSLVWATYVNYAVLFISIAFVFGTYFFWVLLLNMFTLIIFFIARFEFKLFLHRKSIGHEE